MAGPFNPDVQPQNEHNYLGYSKGVDAPKPDMSKASLFEGLAKGVDSGVKFADQTMQGVLRRITTSEVDKVRGEFGADGAAAMQAGVTSTQPNKDEGVLTGLARSLTGLGKDKEESAVPQEIEKQGDYLRNLTDAYQSGRLKESHYWARLDSVSRQMRYRFSGYREQIDNLFQEITGHNPANRVIAELRQEAMKGNTHEQSQYDTWTKHLIDLGDKYGDPSGQEMMRDAQRGKKWDINDIKLAAANIQQRAGQQNARRLQFEMGKLEGEDARRGAYDLARKEIGDGFDNHLRLGVNSLFGKDIDSYNSKMRQLQQSMTTEGRKVYSADELAQIDGMQRDFMSKVHLWSNDRLTRRDPESGFTYGDKLHPEDRKKILDELNEKASIWFDGLRNKDYGTLAVSSGYLKATENSDDAKLLDSPGGNFWRSVGAAKRVGGNEYMKIFIGQEADQMLPPLWKAARDTFHLRVATGTPGQENLDSNLREWKQKTGQTNAGFNNQMAESTLSVLRNDKIPYDVLKNYTEYMYGEGNSKLLFNPDDKAGTFARVSHPYDWYMKIVGDPKVTENLLKYKDKDPEMWSKFSQWRDQNFNNLLKSTAADANSLITQNPNVRVGYDAETNSFRVDGQGTYADNVMARGVVEKLNKTVQGLATSLKAEGKDVTGEINDRIARLGIQVNASKQGSGPQNLFEQAMNAIARVTNPGKPSYGPGSGVTRTKDVAPILDFIGGAEGAGYNTTYGGREASLTGKTVSQVLQMQQEQRAQGAKSTAMGKYQVLQKTLLEATRDLGLDPENTKFDADTQDKIALWALNRRGLEDFMAGKVSKETFATEIAKEWASLPRSDTGKSHYDGDGLNKSQVSKEQVLRLLDRINPQPESKPKSQARPPITTGPIPGDIKERYPDPLGLRGTIGDK